MAGNVATRRSSFRKSLIEAELPDSYLEQLEAKRRQLDDSIHKYVASKEREYKAYEKDLKLRHTRAVDGDAHGGRSEEVGTASAKRRTSSESTQDAGDAGDHAAVGVLLANSSRKTPLNGGTTASGQNHERALPTRGPQAVATASAESRRRSIEKNKDFVGLFTPPFLPALQDKKGAEEPPHLDRHSSAPSMVGSLNTEEDGVPGEMNRASSDTVIQAQMRRPAHLQLSQRTSSSGSSVDGKLISALKSPTDAMRTKRKRVSLAVGDEIVAPSDSVPAMMQRTNSTPSHSRVRTPISEERLPEEEEGPAISSSLNEVARDTTSSIASNRGRTEVKDMQPAAATGAMRRSNQRDEPSPAFAGSSLDADGDLFDLEESGTEPFPELPDMDMPETEEVPNEITGRVGNALPLTQPEPPPPLSVDELPPMESTAVPAAPPFSATPDSDPVALSFNPRSAAQPSSKAGTGKIAAGFRRPSAAADPIVKEEDVVSGRRASNEASSLYGSSFNKPTTTASFTGGSLGESYMARHAEEMMRRREGRSRG